MRYLKSPIWLVLIASLSVQFGGVFGKSLFGIVDASTLAWLRMTFAVPILLAIAHPRLRGRKAIEWKYVIAYGAVMGVMNFAIYQALARIPVGMAVTIEFLGPLAVAFLGIRRWRDVVWIVLAGIGVGLPNWSGVVFDWVGVAWAVIAAICWAGYILLAVPTGKYWDGVGGVAIGSIAGPLLFVVPAITADAAAIFDLRVLGGAALVAVFSSVIPYGLEMIALRKLHSAPFSIMMSLEPAIAALIALLLLGETLSMVEVAAVACVIVASIGATLTMGSRKPGDKSGKFFS